MKYVAGIVVCLLLLSFNAQAQYSEKITVVLLPYQFIGNSYNQDFSWISIGFPDILRDCFNKHYKQYVRILDRERIDQHLKEQQLVQAGFTNEEHSLETGKYFSANFSIYGNISCPSPQDIMITAKVVDVETSEQVTVKVMGHVVGWFKNLGDSLVHKIYPELIRFQQQQKTNRVIEKVITNEIADTSPQSFHLFSAKSMGANAYFYKAVEYIQNNQWQKAEVELKRAIELDPDFARAYVNLGTVYLNMNEFYLAKDHFLKALQIYPECDLAYHSLGLLAANMNDFQSAIGYFNNALKIAPDNCEILTEIGKAYYKLNDLELARQQFTNTLLSDSTYIAANYYLGMIHAKSKSYIAAEKNWLRVVKSDEIFFRSFKQMALEKLGYLALNIKKNPDEAIQYYEQALNFPTDSMNDLNLKLPLANAYLMINKPENAQILLSELVDKFPDNVEARYLYAVSLHKTSNFDLAIVHFEAVTKTVSSGRYFDSAKKYLKELKGY